MDVDKCHHLCKIDSSYYPREAESFEMRIKEIRGSFGGFLQVTIFAATKEPRSIFGALLETFFPFSREAKRVPCMKGKGITISLEVSRFVHMSVMYNDVITSNNHQIWLPN